MPGNVLTTALSSMADAFRLLTEKPPSHAPTLSLVIVEPTAQMSHEGLHRLVTSSLPQLARFRSRLAERPLGVGPPFWTEIDSFDPSAQIHRATLQAPGGEREFADLIAHLSSRSPRRREMLWEAWSIDGLAGGRWALAVQLSPALIGANAQSIWSRLLRSDADRADLDDKPQQSGPDRPGMSEVVAEVVGEIFELQFKALYLIAEGLTGLVRAAGGPRSDRHDAPAGEPVPPPQPSMRGPLPRNAFSAPPTDRRAVAFSSIAQADVETVSTAFGGDATNVLLAACTMSLRAWLQRHGAVPDDPMEMWMPLALPAGDRDAPTAGQIRIPVQLSDPIEILTNLHTATERMNTAHSRDEEREPFIVDTAAISSLIPSPLLYAGTNILRWLDPRRRQVSHAVVAADTGHSSATYYCAGAQVVARHTVIPLAQDRGVTITPTTHGEEVHLSVCVCPDNVPAVDEIATGIVDALATLVTAAHDSPRGQGRSVVTEMATHTRNRRVARGY